MAFKLSFDKPFQVALVWDKTETWNPNSDLVRGRVKEGHSVIHSQIRVDILLTGHLC